MRIVDFVTAPDDVQRMPPLTRLGAPPVPELAFSAIAPPTGPRVQPSAARP